MDAKTIDNKIDTEGLIYTETDTGSRTAVLAMILTVALIGYVSNIIEMGAQTHISGWLRAMGAYFPPLGALLGLM